MESLKPFDTENVGLGRHISKKVVASTGIGGGDGHIDRLSDLLGDLAYGLLVKGVAHCGCCVGSGRLATRSSKVEETFLLCKMLDESERGEESGKR